MLATQKQTRNRTGHTVKREAALMAAERATLPTSPCFRCGARGWCGHDGRRPE